MRHTKKKLLLLTLLLTAALGMTGRAKAQQPAPAQNAQKPGEASKIKFSEVSHDFGKVEQNASLKYSFVFKNEGKGTLIIENVKASCGCTVALASAKEIPPGGEGKIDATLKTSTHGGKVNKTVTVTTNDPAQQTIKLNLIAEVQVMVTLEPFILNFGRFKKGEAQVRYISVTGEEKDKTKILSTTARGKEIKVETSTNGYDHSKDKRIKVSVLPDVKVGQFRDVITVTTDHRTMQNITISVFGEVAGAINVTPRSFSFGFFEKGKAMEKIVSLTANPPATFKILKAESTSPDVKIDVVPVVEGKEYQVKARVKDTFDKDSLRGNIIITTDNKDQPTVEVMYFGRLQKGPMTGPGVQRQPSVPMAPAPVAK